MCCHRCPTGQKPQHHFCPSQCSTTACLENVRECTHRTLYPQTRMGTCIGYQHQPHLLCVQSSCMKMRALLQSWAGLHLCSMQLLRCSNFVRQSSMCSVGL